MVATPHKDKQVHTMMSKRKIVFTIGLVVTLLAVACLFYVIVMPMRRFDDTTRNRAQAISSARYISEAPLPKEKFTVLFEDYSDACVEGCQVVSFQTCAYKIDKTGEMLTVLWADAQNIVRRVLLATSGAGDQKARDLLQSQLQAQLNRPAHLLSTGSYTASPRGIAPIYQIDAKTRITTYRVGSLLKKHATPAYFYLQDTRNPNGGLFFYWETDLQDYILSHGIYGS